MFETAEAPSSSLEEGGSAAPRADQVWPAGHSPSAGVEFGDYLLEEEVAHGGMGVVYRARQRSLERTVAVKLLLLGRYSSSESIDRFRREAHAAASLRHPAIVAIYEVGEWEGQHFFSMEFVDGSSLAALLRQGPLNPRRAAEYARAIAEAISYAHSQGVLHRDLKPSNVLIDPLDQIRITDFGLAKKLDGSSDLTVTGQMIGSPNYLSPEQSAGRQSEVGPASDVYAMGALLYELLTGRPPFLAESLAQTLQRIQNSEPVPLRTLNARIPADLETICLKCLQKAPVNRYDSAKALAQDLARFLAGQPILAKPVTPWVRAARWAWREPKLAGMLFATLAAMAGLLMTLGISNIRIRSAQHLTAAKAEESRQRLVRLNVSAGNKLVEEGDAFGSLLWFVEALRLDQSNPARDAVHRRRIGAVLRQAPVLQQIWFHEGTIESAEFNRDGSRVLTADHLGTVLLWNSTSGRLAAPKIQADSGLVFAHLLPDQRHIITLSTNALKLWRVSDGSALDPSFPGLALDSAAADFSPDGRWLAWPVAEGVQLFDATTCTPFGVPIPCSHPLKLVRFSFDGRRLAGIGDDSVAHVWEVPSGKLLMDSPAHPQNLRLMAMRPDGQQIATVSGMRDLYVWDVPSGKMALPVLHPGDDIYDCQFSPDNRWLLTGSWGGLARAFDLTTGAPLGDSMRHRGGIVKARFNSDGSLIATASWDATARLWDPKSGRPASVALAHANEVNQVAFGPDGNYLLTISAGCVRLWGYSTNSPARLILQHRAPVRSGCFSPDGTRILTCTFDKLAYLWNGTNGASLHCYATPGVTQAGQFSPDGRTMAIGCGSGEILLVEAITGRLLRSLNHPVGLGVVAFSPDGTRLVSCGHNDVRIWDLTGNLVLPPLKHDASVWAVNFSRDGRRLATASKNGVARVWDAQSGRLIAQTSVQPAPLHQIQFSPNGRWIFTAYTGDPGRAQIWDAQTGQPIGPPLSHPLMVNCAVFSHSGGVVATASEDQSAQIWMAASGQQAAPPLRHASVVNSVEFSPDDRLLLTASSDSGARIWDAATGEAVTPPLMHGAQVNFGTWSPDGNEILTCCNDGIACLWDVRPTLLPLAELQRQAELLSAHRLHETSGVVPLTQSELKHRWDSRPHP